MPQVDFKALPPAEAIEFFRRKGFPVGFDWQDFLAAACCTLLK